MNQLLPIELQGMSIDWTPDRLRWRGDEAPHVLDLFGVVEFDDDRTAEYHATMDTDSVTSFEIDGYGDALLPDLEEWLNRQLRRCVANGGYRFNTDTLEYEES